MAKTKKKNVPAVGQQKLEKQEELSLFWECMLISGQILGFFLFCHFCYQAFTIRLFAVKTYGNVLHEYDPWFNFRATQYLQENGYEKFLEWFDYQSWYPMGRPVGTTVYPGLMLSTVSISKLLEIFEWEVTLNDLCVYLPAFFSILTCAFTFLLSFEITKSGTGALVSMGLISIIPAHVMRTVAGGFDNECLAFFIIVATFYFWVRSLRDEKSWYFSIIAGLFYTYLASTWGAYIFVLNLISLHGAVIIISGNFSFSIQFAYSLFYVVGTAGAMQLPMVGNLPFNSLEQISGLVVFALMQVAGLLLFLKKQYKLSSQQFSILIFFVFAAFVAVAAVGVSKGLESGDLLPLSARVRGLFVKHTKTGNPLIDSVAEHRATPMHVFSTYFSFVYLFVPLSLLLSAFIFPYTAGTLFFWVYLMSSMYFSLKMIRLVVLLAPPACIAAGSVIGMGIEWSFSVFSGSDNQKRKTNPPFIDVGGIFKNRALRLLFAAIILISCSYLLSTFYVHSWNMAPMLSEPTIMMRGTSKLEGNEVIIDDYREGYNWIKENTPEDARILSWWDYGYHINGISNRTSLADGNTWNHEHIALIGKIFMSPERQAIRMARHLADYVLIWTGKWAGGVMGDDLVKANHMAKIAGSVFGDIDAEDYYMESQSDASPALSDSLLFKLHQWRFNKDATQPLYFNEVFISSTRALRVYQIINVDKDSKQYGAEHHTYPPALEEFLGDSQKV